MWWTHFYNKWPGLQKTGDAFFWRPLHKASGSWFWWGAKGPEFCKKLYLLMYDRMVNHHGLKNLIWVWTSQQDDYDWYPGDDVVEMIKCLHLMKFRI
jgi:mannan endo-1,4-beta-mannosidase